MSDAMRYIYRRFYRYAYYQENDPSSDCISRSLPAVLLPDRGCPGRIRR